MLRSLTQPRPAGAVALLLLALPLSAAIFPDQVGEFKKGTPKTIGFPTRRSTMSSDSTPPNPPNTSRLARNSSRPPGGSATQPARWRCLNRDGHREQRPAVITKLSCTTSDGIIFAFGNYVFQITGAVPAPPVLKELYARLPKLDQSGLPAL
jgi:hypothetical protein